MSRFLSPRFAALKQYIPGEQPQNRSFIKLNTNESPYPPSPEVVAAICRGEVEKLRLYSDPQCRVLRQTLAAHYGVEPENVIVGNGSDEILSFIFMAFCDSERGVAFPDISYGFYPVYADLYGLDRREIPLREDFSLCAEDYCGINRTIVFANPNAPTGLAISPDEVERIVKSNPDNVVAVDEAYVDFGGESCVSLTKTYDNLLVVQTFSKSRSLAGARLGYAIGSDELIADLERLRNSTNPYNVNRLTLIAGQRAVESQSYYYENCAKTAQTRDKTAESLRALGFSCTDSKANFIFAEHSKLSGIELYSGLRERGILVRHFNKPRIDNHVRITVGTSEQMEALVAAIKEML